MQTGRNFAREYLQVKQKIDTLEPPLERKISPQVIRESFKEHQFAIAAAAAFFEDEKTVLALYVWLSVIQQAKTYFDQQKEKGDKQQKRLTYLFSALDQVAVAAELRVQEAAKKKKEVASESTPLLRPTVVVDAPSRQEMEGGVLEWEDVPLTPRRPLIVHKQSLFEWLGCCSSEPVDAQSSRYYRF